MPRPNDAKQWKPDAFGQQMIDRIANYVLVTERCAAELRSFDQAHVQELWPQVQTKFLSDTVKYPSAMSAQDDPAGTKQFHLKCDRICFPPESKRPRTAEGLIIMMFAAYAELQCTMSQDLSMHPYAGEIDYRANLQALKALDPKGGYDAVEFDSTLRDKPIDLLHETINVRDKASGKIVECTVVDCGTSMVKGDYFVLEDAQGRKKQVSAEQLRETRV